MRVINLNYDVFAKGFKLCCLFMAGYMIFLQALRYFENDCIKIPGNIRCVYTGILDGHACAAHFVYADEFRFCIGLWNSGYCMSFPVCHHMQLTTTPHKF